MKKYMVYLDDGKDCFKVAVPAVNEKAARKYVEGNGEVIAVREQGQISWFVTHGKKRKI